MFMSFRSLALAAASALGLSALPATAATLTYATTVVNFSQGSDALGNPVVGARSDPNSALGAPTAPGAPGKENFVSLGFGGSITLGFGKTFGSPSAIIEITNLSRESYKETADVFGITWGGAEVLLASITNALETTTIHFSGAYRYMKIVDTTADKFPTIGSVRDGFDLNAVGVTPIPLPAGGLLLVGGLAGLAALRRRKAAA